MNTNLCVPLQLFLALCQIFFQVHVGVPHLCRKTGCSRLHFRWSIHHCDYPQPCD